MHEKQDHPGAPATPSLAQSMLDALDDAVAAWGATGEVLDYNRAFADLLGLPEKPAPGLRLDAVLSEPAAASLLPPTPEAATAGFGFGAELELADADGAGLYIRVLVTARALADGAFVYHGVFRQVAAPGLARVSEVLSSAVFALDSRGRVMYWSQGAGSLYGIDSSEALGRPLEEVLPGHPLAQAPAGQMGPSRSRTLLERPGHPPLLVSRAAAPLRGLDGHLAGALDMATDATDSWYWPQTAQQAEAAVLRSRDLVVMVDMDYRVTLANPAYLHYQRRQREEVVGRSAAEVVGEAVFAATLKPRLEECFRGLETHFEMYRLYEHLGRRHLLVSYYPIASGEEVVGAAAIFRDTTPQQALAR